MHGTGHKTQAVHPTGRARAENLGPADSPHAGQEGTGVSGPGDILPSVGPNADGVTLCHWAMLGLCWKMPAGQKFIGAGPGEWAIQNVSGTKFNLSQLELY